MTLTVSTPDRPSRSYRLDARSTCLVGRGSDCQVRVSAADTQVSRRHCLFMADPPRLWVRDLSRNGTFVNGGRVVQEQDLVDGDEVRVGRTVISVSVTGASPPGVPQCAHCGRISPDGSGAGGGALVCMACRHKPEAVVRTLLARADAGDPDLALLCGYRVVRELGRGGQGVVYLLCDADGERVVALKTLLAQVAVDADARAGFLREVENTRALHHPNIVRFGGYASVGAAFLFTTEYCPLGSVDQVVSRLGRPLRVAEAVPIVAQVLDGLSYAHQTMVPVVRLADGDVLSGCGLVHRDVKPQNILLSGPPTEPVAKIADFGLAKAFDRAGLSGHTASGAVGGSYAFMARAQILDYKYARPDVDVWAAIASLYWMLTLATPRDFPGGQDPVAVVLRDDAVPIRERVPSVPARLAAAIDAGLAEAPSRTAMEAGEVKRSLLEALPAG
ncbi:protein kinase [Micromonospora sp. NPDC005806]|uniref:protein kinase domain-containing protein n=1 Tax=Micromonospora sp. NPDC005806 TaxID=3364234 RepID=UPI003686C2B9